MCAKIAAHQCHRLQRSMESNMCTAGITTHVTVCSRATVSKVNCFSVRLVQGLQLALVVLGFGATSLGPRILQIYISAVGYQYHINIVVDDPPIHIPYLSLY